MTSKPDNWVVIFFDGDDPHYKVLCGWSGGYTQGSSWRMNSGITRVEETETTYNFFGSSGSCYSCGKQSYGLKMNNAYIWNKLHIDNEDKVQLLDENTDWLAMDWLI